MKTDKVNKGLLIIIGFGIVSIVFSTVWAILLPEFRVTKQVNGFGETRYVVEQEISFFSITYTPYNRHSYYNTWHEADSAIAYILRQRTIDEKREFTDAE